MNIFELKVQKVVFKTSLNICVSYACLILIVFSKFWERRRTAASIFIYANIKLKQNFSEKKNQRLQILKNQFVVLISYFFSLRIWDDGFWLALEITFIVSTSSLKINYDVFPWLSNFGLPFKIKTFPVITKINLWFQFHEARFYYLGSKLYIATLDFKCFSNFPIQKNIYIKEAVQCSYSN